MANPIHLICNTEFHYKNGCFKLNKKINKLNLFIFLNKLCVINYIINQHNESYKTFLKQK